MTERPKRVIIMIITASVESRSTNQSSPFLPVCPVGTITMPTITSQTVAPVMLLIFIASLKTISALDVKDIKRCSNHFCIREDYDKLELPIADNLSTVEVTVTPHILEIFEVSHSWISFPSE